MIVYKEIQDEINDVWGVVNDDATITPDSGDEWNECDGCDDEDDDDGYDNDFGDYKRRCKECELCYSCPVRDEGDDDRSVAVGYIVQNVHDRHIEDMDFGNPDKGFWASFDTIENVTFVDCTFSDVGFTGKLTNVKFIECGFDGQTFLQGCEFSGVTFEDCEGNFDMINNNSGYDTVNVIDCEFDDVAEKPLYGCVG